MPGARATFTPHDRLTTRGQFQRVFRRGRRLDGDGFLLIASSNEEGRGRLGLAIGRRVGGAVARNRARRLLREVFRLNRAALVGDLDLVIVAKPGLAERGFGEVEREYRRRLESLARRGHGRDRPRPAATD